MRVVLSPQIGKSRQEIEQEFMKQLQALQNEAEEAADMEFTDMTTRKVSQKQ